MTALVWFKNDFRTHDHTPLTNACQQHEQVIALTFNCDTQWKLHHYSKRRIQLQQQATHDLSHALDHLHIPLIEIQCDTFDDCPPLLAKVCQQLNIKTVYANREYALNEINRDQQCNHALKALNVTFIWSDDQMIVPPELILTQQETPYKVFSSYKKNWLTKFMPTHPVDPPRPRTTAATTGKWPTLSTSRDQAMSLETSMLDRLSQFCETSISEYAQSRDIPSIKGTSELSGAFTVGLISPHRAAYIAHTVEHSIGANTWLSELAWRDFYRYIVFHYPRVCQGHAFNRSTDAIQWNCDDALFEAWSHGKTGIPLVDAGMRQLRSTGWMHNRVRMVTAMFLSKNCFLNWRLGEQFFMEHLIDGDFPSNNGGWQWSASTGVDAAPYFRIFNPVQQAKRFDKDAHYIREWVSELKDTDTKTILRIGEEKTPSINGYPKAIVNLKESRIQAIETFKIAR